MPVEIKELVIRAVVESDREEAQRAAGGKVSDEEDKNAIVEACVKEVLRILKSSRER